MRFILLCLALVLPLQATRLGFLPFSNSTKYKGNWALERDIPRYFEKRLAKTYDLAFTDSIFAYLKNSGLSLYPNLPEHKRQVAGRFKADLLIGGDIAHFLVSKRIVGEGKYGGLKSYFAEIKIKVKVYSLSQNAVIYDNDLVVEKKETNTAVNLGRLSRDEELFDSLNTENFGSETFDRSIAGAMMQEAGEKMLALILGLPVSVAKKGESKRLIKTAKVVDLNEADVFINAGLEDQVTIGDVYTVVAPGDTLRDPDTREVLGVSEKLLGTIEIAEVKAAHFSRARRLNIKDTIRLKDLVRVEK
jgi:hypothetical protein